jgi:hypothetical protein
MEAASVGCAIGTWTLSTYIAWHAGRLSSLKKTMISKKNHDHLVVFLGDTHCGSTVGLCPEEGLELDDGGWYQPNKSQIWLWNNWLDAWKRVKKMRRSALKKCGAEKQNYTS